MGIRASQITEEAFMKQVVQLAQLRGWRVAHFRAARTMKGWRTPGQFQAKGFPDLVLVRDRVIVAELKRTAKDEPSAEQLEWLRAFDGAGVENYLWTPGDWVEIERILR